MEPTEVARLEGSDLFQRAAATADRFLENIETVVHGKRDEIKLVFAAMICGGHVLFEDVPGTAKTVLARAIFEERAAGPLLQDSSPPRGSEASHSFKSRRPFSRPPRF